MPAVPAHGGQGRSRLNHAPIRRGLRGGCRNHKKTAKVARVSEFLQSLSPEDAATAAIFLTGRPFAHRDERVLGVGGSQLVKVVAKIAKPMMPTSARVTAPTAISGIWPNIYC